MGNGYIDPNYRYFKTYDSRTGPASSGNVHFRDTKSRQNFIRKPDGAIEDRLGEVYMFNEVWELERTD